MKRTREIGIVLAIFLAEATLTGMMACLIGVFTGYGLSHVLAYALSGFMQPQHEDTGFKPPDAQKMTTNPAFSTEWTVIALTFAIIVCIIFGLYPARKAAKQTLLTHYVTNKES